MNDTGWEAYSKALCDVSCINATYFSNHTLKHIGFPGNEGGHGDVICPTLFLNLTNNGGGREDDIRPSVFSYPGYVVGERGRNTRPSVFPWLSNEGEDNRSIPHGVSSLLRMNRSSNDKKQIAMLKVLRFHPRFDMSPFFEWDMKLLPVVSSWFDGARACTDTIEKNVDKRKLDAIYQFIHTMPEVFEPAPAEE